MGARITQAVVALGVVVVQALSPAPAAVAILEVTPDNRVRLITRQALSFNTTQASTQPPTAALRLLTNRQSFRVAHKTKARGSGLSTWAKPKLNGAGLPGRPAERGLRAAHLAVPEQPEDHLAGQAPEQPGVRPAEPVPCEERLAVPDHLEEPAPSAGRLAEQVLRAGHLAEPVQLEDHPVEREPYGGRLVVPEQPGGRLEEREPSAGHPAEQVPYAERLAAAFVQMRCRP